MGRASGLRSGAALSPRSALAVVAALALGGPAAAEPRPAAATWILEPAGLQSSPGAPAFAVAVGSLQKPFVAEAWARAKGEAETPRFTCRGGASCWLKTGHGTLGLARATALSCNSYFRQLAAEVAPEALASVLREQGFSVAGPLVPEAAIGLDTPPGIVTIAPEALLRAYVRLTRVPWASGEPVRREVLRGLRASAQDGTAKALGQRGYWAKTGTVAQASGIRTVGWALAVDDSGWAMLARAEPATGREAAAVLGESLAAERPWGRAAPTASNPGSPAAASAVEAGRVRVRLFDRLRPESVRVRNLGPAPAASATGFVGPGATLGLRPGDRLGESTWEIRIPGTGLLRVLHAALSAAAQGEGALSVVAEMERREYVSGVIAAELLEPDAERRVALGAALLRFLARGPRHEDADVCDNTHCAFFIGRGPRVVWISPRRASPVGSAIPPVDEALWSEVQAAAREPGPDQWTSHCGGKPLSAHAVWGGNDRSVRACALHGPADSRAWSRAWSAAAVDRALGGPIRSLRVTNADGVWGLELQTDAGGWRVLRFDEAHRLLAAVLGWGSLPSPADRISPAGSGWRAEGVGLGHRVGLCLGPRERRLALLTLGDVPAR